MHEIKNLTNSPFDLEALDGPKRLPALGTVTGRFDPNYVEALGAVGLYEVRQVEVPKAPAKEPAAGRKAKS